MCGQQESNSYINFILIGFISLIKTTMLLHLFIWVVLYIGNKKYVKRTQYLLCFPKLQVIHLTFLFREMAAEMVSNKQQCYEVNL
jgi:hypothetical protein